MEDPCHMGMLRVLRSKNYPIIPVPVDEQGLRTDLLENIESAVGSAVRSSAGAVYVTPSHQFPLD